MLQCKELSEAVVVSVVAATCSALAVSTWDWPCRGCGGWLGLLWLGGEPGWLVGLCPRGSARAVTGSAWKWARRFDGSTNLPLSTCLTALRDVAKMCRGGWSGSGVETGWLFSLRTAEKSLTKEVNLQ